MKFCHTARDKEQPTVSKMSSSQEMQVGWLLADKPFIFPFLPTEGEQFVLGSKLGADSLNRFLPINMGPTHPSLRD